MSRQPSIDYVRNILAMVGDLTAISAFNDLMNELEARSRDSMSVPSWPQPMICERYTAGTPEMGWNNCVYRSIELGFGIPDIEEAALIVSPEEKAAWLECREAMLKAAATHNAIQRSAWT